MLCWLISPAVHLAGSGTACRLPGGQCGWECLVVGPVTQLCRRPQALPSAPQHPIPTTGQAETAACGRWYVSGSRQHRASGCYCTPCLHLRCPSSVTTSTCSIHCTGGFARSGSQPKRSSRTPKHL